MANRLFQTVIHQMQSALQERKAGIIDETGNIIACTDVNDIGASRELAASRAKEIGDAIIVENVTYRRIGVRNRSEFVVFCSGSDEFSKSMVEVLSVAFGQIKQFYDEKYDKNSFIKNILEDNIMPGDIHVKSKALHLNLEAPRLAFLIRTNNDEFSAHEMIEGLFPDKNKDFVISMNETDVVLIKLVEENMTDKDFEKIALALKSFEFKVTGNTGFINSQATAGGISTSEFSDKTLMSKKHHGLFACGEILDIDGDCGGFNLTWAFASGILAAKSAINFLGEFK